MTWIETTQHREPNAPVTRPRAEHEVLRAAQPDLEETTADEQTLPLRVLTPARRGV
jgi:hypothetical protein